MFCEASWVNLGALRIVHDAVGKVSYVVKSHVWKMLSFRKVLVFDISYQLSGSSSFRKFTISGRDIRVQYINILSGFGLVTNVILL